jgi:hypothetical protein
VSYVGNVVLYGFQKNDSLSLVHGMLKENVEFEEMMIGVILMIE